MQIILTTESLMAAKDFLLYRSFTIHYFQHQHLQFQLSNRKARNAFQKAIKSKIWGLWPLCGFPALWHTHQDAEAQVLALLLSNQAQSSSQIVLPFLD